MGRLSGNIRISRKEEVAPLPSITKKDKKNYFGFNKGCTFVSQQSSSEYTTSITQRPEVHGFDVRIRNSNVTFNNYIARIGNLKLPKNGRYFISFDCWCSENYNQARFYVDLCDATTSPYADKGFHSDGSEKVHYSAFVDVTNYNLLEGFFDFNLTSSSISTGTVYHIENLMITDSDEEVDFVRPIEDIIANTLNGIDRPPQMVRRRIAEKNTWYSNGKDLLNDETITYLDIVVPYGTKDIANANVYMCVNSMSFNENPTDSVLASSSNWKRLPNRGVYYMDTLITNTVDSNNVAAQNIILKSGNTVNGALTGVPGSQASNSAIGGEGYYMWIGSSNANNAPFSVDVNGNVTLGGNASFNRNVVEMKNDFTISTSTKESIFHCLCIKNEIDVTINDGNYNNKEIEIVNATPFKGTNSGARRVEINRQGGIKFIIQGDVVDSIVLNDVGSVVKLRHIFSSSYDGSSNYFVIMNPEAFTIDNSRSVVFAKPIPFVGKPYDINLTIKSKDWYFDKSNRIATFTDQEAEDNGIFVNTNLPEEIRGWNGETKKLLVGVKYEITITKYNKDGTETKYKFSGTSDDNTSHEPMCHIYLYEHGSAPYGTLTVIDLDSFYYKTEDPFNGLFSKNNKVFLEGNSYYSENKNAVVHSLFDAKDNSSSGFLGIKLIIKTPDYWQATDSETNNNPDYPTVNFNGTLYVNK